MSFKQSATDAQKQLEKQSRRKRGVIALSLLPALLALQLNAALAALYLALLGGVLVVRFYLQRQRIDEQSVSTVIAASSSASSLASNAVSNAANRAGSGGPVQLQGHLTGDVVKSPMTASDCVFWRLEFHAQQESANNDHRVLVATVFSRPYVAFSDETGVAWIRAQDVDWHLQSKQGKIFAQASDMGEFESWLGHGFVDRWYEQCHARPIKYASDWMVVETLVRADTPLFVEGHIQKRRSNQTDFDDLDFDDSSQMGFQGSPVDCALANEPIVCVHDSQDSDTESALKQAWVGVLQQIEGHQLGGSSGESLSGSHEINVLTRGSDAKASLEIYEGSKANGRRLLSLKMYLSLALVAISLGYLAVMGPEQLPIAIEQLKGFFARS